MYLVIFPFVYEREDLIIHIYKSFDFHISYVVHCLCYIIQKKQKGFQHKNLLNQLRANEPE